MIETETIEKEIKAKPVKIETTGARIFYLGRQLRNVFDFDETNLERYEYIGEFERTKQLYKTVHRGVLKPEEGYHRKRWYRDSIRHNNGYYYIEGYKIAEQLNYDPKTGGAAFFLVNYESIKPEKPYKIFVAMPFAEELDDTFEAIKEVGQRLQKDFEEIEVFRIDMHQGEAIDLPKVIIQNIMESGIIIADLTLSNQNVYYELGVADALKKKVIQIARSSNELKFDVAHKKTIIFKNYKELKSRLENDVKAIWNY